MNEFDYVCNECGKLTPRQDLVVKKVLFTGMGAGASTIRARVTKWLCDSCTLKDSDWNRPANEQPSERVARKAEVNG